MSWTRHRSTRWLAVLMAVSLLACLATGVVTNSSAAAGPETGRAVPAPPLLPPIKSPVDSFRALLLMPTAEQQKLLAARPPEIRERILQKIREYRSLTSEERELRLQATELRWYLVPLLSVPATNRAARLALIPQPTRDLVEARLQHWTLLPPPLRQVLLTNEQALAYLTYGGGVAKTPSSPTETLRRKMQQTVERFFELTQKEKEKTLGNFSEIERQQMEKSLAAFEELTPAQRGRCVRSYTRFATLSPEERHEFLKNAERWSQMTLTEREAWRELVSRARILPPLPILPYPPQASATSRPPAAASGN
jgi:hypothetical protein